MNVDAHLGAVACRTVDDHGASQRHYGPGGGPIPAMLPIGIADERQVDLQVHLLRLADLHTQVAGELRALAATVGLASGAERALMCDVQTTKSLLSVRDVAERLALSERTVRRLRRQGVLPKGIEIGGVIRWRPESIEEWIAEQVR